MDAFSLGPVLFTTPSALFAAALAGIAAILLAALGRIRLSRWPRFFFTLGIVLLMLGAGRPAWLGSAVGRVVVMVDLSPSTRGASFRQTPLLRRRLAELLADKPFDLLLFSDRNQTGSLDGDALLADLPCDQTFFAPPPADAVVLFSDGRFPPPGHSAPVYPVLDPSLENVGDAAITGMEYVGNQVAVSVANNGPPRTLTLSATAGSTTQTVQGNQTFLFPATGSVGARLSHGDLWPENDSMSIRPSPPLNSELWWMGDSPPPGWRAVSALASDPADYLAPAVIVLNNISAEELSAVSQDRLEQYVRDLGGSLLLCGGDRAFAAGGYDGTVLQTLSPLSSSPPSPAQLWILLADSSGSMAQPAGDGRQSLPNGRQSLRDGVTRWDLASRAIAQLLPRLPPLDSVRVGQFSDAIRWWSDGRPAGQTARLQLPPPDALPHGPTNLAPALQALARSGSRISTQLILLTDADAEIDDPAGLTKLLNAANIHFHILAIARGSGLAVLEQIAVQTGGSYLIQDDPSRWAMASRQLMTAARSNRVGDQPISVQFVGPAAGISGGMANQWNPTWLAPQATPLATADGAGTVAATWQFGSGRVAALAFAARSRQAVAVARLIAQPPRDPRLRVSWEMGPMLRVTVDAGDNAEFLNNLSLTLEIWNPISGASTHQPIAQTAPGRYELSTAGATEPGIASVLQGKRVIDRVAVAGWYPPEFAAVGEDTPALESLASQSGGMVIPPGQTSPIQFNWPRRSRELTSWFAAGAACLIAAGLVVWKIRG